MKKIIISLLIILFFSKNALAITLYEALNDTFKNNTQLNAERENIKASEEDINISQADYMPSLTLTGTKSFEDTNKLTNQSGGDASVSDVNPLTSSIKLEQTLLDYGRDLSHEKNIVGLELAKAKLTKKEQDVIYSAIEAFTGLILAREKLEINRRNLNLLIRQVETDKVRLDRGQITITDLSQNPL
jgi:outer membrane protein